MTLESMTIPREVKSRSAMPTPFVVIQTHPVQYHAPVYRALQAAGLQVTAVYGSDFSVAGYRDREFGQSFSWDTDLLSGYSSHFLSRVSDGGPAQYEDVRARGLRRILKTLRPQAVLLNGYGSRFDRGAMVAVWRLGIPFLFRGETTDHAQRRTGIRQWLRDRILARMYARSRALLYIGQRSRAHFQRLGVPDQKLFFSPYCVEPRPFQTDETSRESLRQGTRKEWRIQPDQCLILYSGKLVPRKGVDLIPAAVRRLPDSLRSRIVIGFLGDGEMKSALEAAAATTPTLEVRFFGFQNQSRLSAFYHAADVMILPSRLSETWGLVVNEALMHGVPCVTSEMVGSSRDLVQTGVTGEVFATGSLEDCTRALTAVCSYCGTRETRDRCRERVSGYSVTAAAEGILQAYRATIGPTP